MNQTLMIKKKKNSKKTKSRDTPLSQIPIKFHRNVRVIFSPLLHSSILKMVILDTHSFIHYANAKQMFSYAAGKENVFMLFLFIFIYCRLRKKKSHYNY